MIALLASLALSWAQPAHTDAARAMAHVEARVRAVYVERASVRDAAAMLSPFVTLNPSHDMVAR